MNFHTDVEITKWNANAIKSKIRDNIATAALNGVAEDGVQRAKGKVPVMTGALRDSIRVIQQATGNKLEATWGSQLDYAFWVEVGTAGRAGSNYIRSSAQEAHSHLLDRLSGKL